MATVRITGATRQKIAKHIDRMCDNEINKAKTPESMQAIKVDPYDPRILSRFFVEAPHLAAQVPTSWLIYRDSINVCITIVHNDTFINRNVGVFPSRGMQFHVPDAHRYTVIELNTPEAIAHWPELDPFIRFCIASEEIVCKWATVKQKVMDFLGSFSSINSALKAWDGLGLYLPKSIHEQLEEKVHRAKHVAEVPDMSDVTAVAAAYRLGV